MRYLEVEAGVGIPGVPVNIPGGLSNILIRNTTGEDQTLYVNGVVGGEDSTWTAASDVVTSETEGEFDDVLAGMIIILVDDGTEYEVAEKVSDVEIRLTEVFAGSTDTGAWRVIPQSTAGILEDGEDLALWDLQPNDMRTLATSSTTGGQSLRVWMW